MDMDGEEEYGIFWNDWVGTKEEELDWGVLYPLPTMMHSGKQRVIG